MTHKELEAVVTELEEFEKANDSKANGYDSSPEVESRREFASQIGTIVLYCHGLGFNPRPRISPFFETFSVSALPEYLEFEKLVLLAHMQLNKVQEDILVTDSQLFRIYVLVERFLKVAKTLEAQIEFPADPRKKEWDAKQALKSEVSGPDTVREPFDRPNLPIESRDDIENAMKEMHAYWQDNSPRFDALGDFLSMIYDFGLSTSFLGYWLPQNWLEARKGVTLEDIPDSREMYLSQVNKAYRLFLNVRSSGEPTPNQLARMYRISWRTKKLERTLRPILKEHIDRKTN